MRITKDCKLNDWLHSMYELDNNSFAEITLLERDEGMCIGYKESKPVYYHAKEAGYMVMILSENNDSPYSIENWSFIPATQTGGVYQYLQDIGVENACEYKLELNNL